MHVQTVNLRTLDTNKIIDAWVDTNIFFFLGLSLVVISINMKYSFKKDKGLVIFL